MPTPLHQRNVQRCALAIHTACSFFGAEVQNVERQLPARPPQPQASDGFIPFYVYFKRGTAKSTHLCTLDVAILTCAILATPHTTLHRPLRFLRAYYEQAELHCAAPAAASCRSLLLAALFGWDDSATRRCRHRNMGHLDVQQQQRHQDDRSCKPLCSRRCWCSAQCSISGS